MDAVGQRGTDRRPWGLAVAAMCAASAYIALYSLGNIRTHLLRFDALITAAMAVTVLVYRAWDTLAGDNERRAVRLVIIAAVAFRMALLWLPPSLSDDLYRYAWDGHVLANGFNPYAYAPSDPALRSLRDDSYTHLAYKEYHSIYPPVAEIGMGAAAFVSEMCGGSMRATMVVWKLLLIMAELASMLIIVQLLRLWNMPSRRLVLYAWHPLAVIEFAGQGHADALMIAGVLYAVYGIARARRGIGMLGYGFSIASRWVPLIFAPAMARAIRAAMSASSGRRASAGSAAGTAPPQYR